MADWRAQVVRDGIGEGFELLVGCADLFFRPLALDELADLAAEGEHHLHHVVVRRTDFTAQEVHHARYLTCDQDRETECGVQVAFGSVHCAYEGWILED